MKLRKNRKGFTLVELIVVVAVLAILAAIAIPIASSLTSEANTASDASNAATYEAAFERYVATPTTSTPAGSGGIYPTTDTAVCSAIATFAKAELTGGYLPAPKASGSHFYFVLSGTYAYDSDGAGPNPATTYQRGSVFVAPTIATPPANLVALDYDTTP